MIRVIPFVLVLLFSISVVSCNSSQNSVGSQGSQKAKSIEKISSESHDSQNIDIKTNGNIPTRELKIRKVN